ncbi:MAG: hypothetical protein SGJ20_05500 [Planctomycetota bacterium]|nr:hypothetical protein [Planctomycetota bacterium]
MSQVAFRHFGFFKATAVGGLLLLLPLAVVLALLGYVYSAVVLVYEPLKDHLPVKSNFGVGLLFLLAVAILIGLCFVCGLAAQRAIGRQFSEKIEQRIISLFPKYAIYKDILAGTVGGSQLGPTLIPVTIRFDDAIRIGFEADCTEQGLVVVFLPGAPDPWIGSVALVQRDRVERLEIDFNEAAAICERLGRKSSGLLRGVKRN